METGLSFTPDKEIGSAPRVAARARKLAEAPKVPRRAMGDVGSPLLAVLTRFPVHPAKRTQNVHKNNEDIAQLCCINLIKN